MKSSGLERPPMGCAPSDGRVYIPSRGWHGRIVLIAFIGFLQGCLEPGYRNVYEAYSDQDFQQVVDLVGNHGDPGAEMRFIEGDSFRQMRKYGEMNRAFDQCRQLSSEFNALIGNRLETALNSELHWIDSLVTHDQLPLAGEWLSRLDPLGEGKGDYLQLKAFVLDSLRQESGARACYEEMIRMGHGDRQLWSERLVVSLIRDEMWDEALVLIQNQIQERPRELRFHLSRIQAFEALGRHEDLLSAIREAEGIFSDRVEFSMAIGVYYYNQRDYQSAIAYFQKVVTTDSANPLAWYRLAQCRFNRYDFLGAQEAFDRVQQLVPGFLLTRSYYRIIALHLGREEDYARHFGVRLLEFDVSDLGAETVSEKDLDHILKGMEVEFVLRLQQQVEKRSGGTGSKGAVLGADSVAHADSLAGATDSSVTGILQDMTPDSVDTPTAEKPDSLGTNIERLDDEN